MWSIRAWVVWSVLGSMSLFAQEVANVEQIMAQGAEQTARQFQGVIGPQVGQAFPLFALPTASGELIELANVLKTGPAIVTFYRGGWCPYCNRQLKSLQDRLPEIQKRNTTLIAISPERPEQASKTVEKSQLEFYVLSDQGNQVSRQLGLVFTLPKNLQDLYPSFGIDIPEHNGDESYTLPVPATYVVDQQGVVRYAFADVDYKKRANNEDILAALDAINP